MKVMHPLAAMVVAIFVASPAASAAGQAAANTGQGSSVKTSLTPAERGELTRQFVLKWGLYVQEAYGINVETWAMRMVGTFAKADPVNFQKALRRGTFEGAMAQLDGGGHKITDDEVITVLASSDGPIGPYALGDFNQDLVFTPLEPCRIVDTRSTAGGPIAAGTNRGFYAWGFADFTSQGGSATNCGLGGQSPEAVVVNLTAVVPPATGFATMYPANGTLPLAASMIYQGGGVLSNAVTVKLGVSGSVDFRIYSEHTVHYVVDIVGFYDAPHATALECIAETSGPFTVASGSRSFTNVACPAGYAVTGGGADTATNLNSYINASRAVGNAWFSSVQNNSGVTRDYTHYATCCRVPGR